LNERPKINFLSAERVHSHQCHCGLCTAPWHASCLVPFTHSTSIDQNSLDKCYPLSKLLEVVGLEPRLYKGAICVQKSSPHLQTFVCGAWKKSYHAIRNQRLSRMTWNTHLPKMSWGLGGWQGSPKSRNACLRDSAAQSLQGGQFDSPKALVKFVAKRQALPRCRVDLCNTLKWTTRARRKQRLYFVYLYRHMCIIIMYANIIYRHIYIYIRKCMYKCI
jgi:hypothetical protein